MELHEQRLYIGSSFNGDDDSLIFDFTLQFLIETRHKHHLKVVFGICTTTPDNDEIIQQINKFVK